MAKKTEKTKKVTTYKATSTFKTFVTNKGLLGDDQYKDLLGGKSVELNNVPSKQMDYLIANNLIELGE